MFIRLFIKTTDSEKAITIANSILSDIKEDNIRNINITAEPYWKYDNSTVVEVELELVELLDYKSKKQFLDKISNKWICFGEEEVLSSVTMDGCILNYEIEMINIFFNE